MELTTIQIIGIGNLISGLLTVGIGIFAIIKLK